MIETTYQDALASLRARVASVPGGVAAFDGDGTLWAGDVGEDFLHALLEENAFTAVAAKVFRDEAARFGVALAGNARDDLAALFRAYTEGRYPEDRVCGTIALAVAGRPAAEVANVAEAVVRGRDVRGRLHPEAIGIVDECRACGLEVVLVSASPRPVVVAAAKLVGLDASAVVAVTATEAGGTIEPRLDEPIPYGEGKASRLRERLAGRPLVVCAGDNAFDMAMLKLAAMPFAIRPKDRLRAIAHELEILTILGARPT